MLDVYAGRVSLIEFKLPLLFLSNDELLLGVLSFNFLKQSTYYSQNNCTFAHIIAFNFIIARFK